MVANLVIICRVAEEITQCIATCSKCCTIKSISIVLSSTTCKAIVVVLSNNCAFCIYKIHTKYNQLMSTACILEVNSHFAWSCYLNILNSLLNNADATVFAGFLSLFCCSHTLGILSNLFCCHIGKCLIERRYNNLWLLWVWCWLWLWLNGVEGDSINLLYRQSTAEYLNTCNLAIENLASTRCVHSTTNIDVCIRIVGLYHSRRCNFVCAEVAVRDIQTINV